ncbi:hypothetical protein JFL47_09475 [Haemophilus haemoglobinophilus]|nr:hypothetical protein [Canicola haemoglobinophilus]
MSEKLRKFAFHYIHPSTKRACALSIAADSKEEAKEVVKAMSQAIYDGEIFATIPAAPTKPLWLARLLIKLAQKFS